MINGKSVLAVIPARGGSKGLPRKNIREFAGKPLIAWTIEAAQASRLIDRLILSSDDGEIIRVAQDWGCEVPFVRADDLSADEATMHGLRSFGELVVWNRAISATTGSVEMAYGNCVWI